MMEMPVVKIQLLLQLWFCCDCLIAVVACLFVCLFVCLLLLLFVAVVAVVAVVVAIAVANYF